MSQEENNQHRGQSGVGENGENGWLAARFFTWGTMASHDGIKASHDHDYDDHHDDHHHHHRRFPILISGLGLLSAAASRNDHLTRSAHGRRTQHEGGDR